MKDIKELINFGIINIDKPSGPTSFSVSEYVKRTLGLSKTSHMGTLDPKVTGVLPITLGRACKLASYFITHDKTYVGILHTHKKQNCKELQEIIDEKFSGKIKQTPPNRSAVKKAERTREVYYWKIIESDETCRDFLFEAKVQGGTYIRKLCSDLGELIGGAHMGELRRTNAGIFDEISIVSLYEFDIAVEEYKSGKEENLREMIVDARHAIKEVLPVVEIEKRVVKALYTGKPLFEKDVVNPPKFKEGTSFAAFCKNDFIGVYKFVDQGDIFGKSEFVFN